MTGRHTPVEIPVEIAVQPWFYDHRFGGRAVLPAVETLLLMAEQTARRHPDCTVRIMEQARFPKFLPLPAGASTIHTTLTIETRADGSLQTAFASRVRLKACTQVQIHGEVIFPASREQQAPAEPEPAPLTGAAGEIEVNRIYRELVPFGPGYRSLQGNLQLFAGGAVGRLTAPAKTPVERTAYTLLGSPFPLDGALHAACVCGQRIADFIPFPVGFDRRVVNRPTESGADYRTQVELISQSTDELRFNLWIYQDDGEICETVTGLRMRDVSRGKLKPPAWIRS
ncbi:Polyketide synthase dehydratase [Desulfofustis glycolicus DSM 9705]|uniref:Polyketide synthase dehydratase n=2 Tax=Desulfofustis glycolicus TaxID=51195 RepID=A0A1M5UMN6_9BACT|nr:Polyketide synthase dehydratase [Desulfofustis glycolicus DSM 9705]